MYNRFSTPPPSASTASMSGPPFNQPPPMPSNGFYLPPPHPTFQSMSSWPRPPPPPPAMLTTPPCPMSLLPPATLRPPLMSLPPLTNAASGSPFMPSLIARTSAATPMDFSAPPPSRSPSASSKTSTLTPMAMDKKTGLPLELELHREALRQADLLPKMERSRPPEAKRPRASSKSTTVRPNRDPKSNSKSTTKSSLGSQLLSEVNSYSNLVLQSSPASEYYERDDSNPLMLRATNKLLELLDTFDAKCIGNDDNKEDKAYKPMSIKRSYCKGCKHGASGHVVSSSSSSDSDDSSSSSGSRSEELDDHPRDRSNKRDGEKTNSKRFPNGTSRPRNKSKSSRNDGSQQWLRHRQNQPDRLHPELWENRANELIDGPACRCSLKARREGIRHGFYMGEEDAVKLDVFTNNSVNLKHYRLVVSDSSGKKVMSTSNAADMKPTVINEDGKDYVFEGFSIFVPRTMPPLHTLPPLKVKRHSELVLTLVEESWPEHLVVSELKLFHVYLYQKLLDLHDWQLPNGDSFLFMPRFVRLVKMKDETDKKKRDQAEDKNKSSKDKKVIAKELLSMSQVLSYLIKSRQPVVSDEDLHSVVHSSSEEWLRFLDTLTGSVVSTPPSCVPSAIRVDQLDRVQQNNEYILEFPQIVHKGQRPAQLSFIGSIEYQRRLRETRKLKHLIANVTKDDEDKRRRRLETLEEELKDMRRREELRKGFTIALSCQHFERTGIRTDVVHHAMMMPVLVHHIRFHMAVRLLERTIDYEFKDKTLLQLALTHPSYKENFGTNPDHARVTLGNCGPRQQVQTSSLPSSGQSDANARETSPNDTKSFHRSKNNRSMTRKRGINMLISIMSKFGKSNETSSCVAHNERLEFLGDAVVEFITSVHLFHVFPDLEEGGLATFRAALVQNFNLANLADNIGLQHHMLYAHGSDLCHDSELRHAMANCFEALIGAIFLDGGIEAADKVFSKALFNVDKKEDGNKLQGVDEANQLLVEVWTKLDPHPLQSEEPKGDRHWIDKYPLLQHLVKFESSVGIEFTHIRLLARAFTDRSLGFSNLTLGSNQRLEFLGDTVLQLVASDYLYRFFPDHHEGHLSLLRSSLVNNRTQAVVCDDLDLTSYAQSSNPNHEFKTKDKADLLESLLGALYIDKDLEYCQKFAEVCFFPRLTQFIVRQDWNDPKSKLQQCCLTLRSTGTKDPDIPIYKVISVVGPTNTRVYTVAVYFRNDRLAEATGRSIQEAEMNAALKALDESRHLFPHLEYQRRVVERSVKRQELQERRERRQRASEELHKKWLEETIFLRKMNGLDGDEERKVVVTKKRKREEDLEDGECSDAEMVTDDQCDDNCRIEVRGESRLVGYSDDDSREEEKEHGKRALVY